MRTNSLINNPLDNDDPIYKNCVNENGTVTNCEGTSMRTGRQTPTQSATFTACTFRSLIGTGITGGAISFANIENGILTIADCLFEHCEINVSQGNGIGGGAIYGRSVSQVDISLSSFLSCMCNTTNNSDG